MNAQCTCSYKLSEKQRQSFLDDGVLVVESLLDSQELAAARRGLTETLERYGITFDDDPHTAKHLVNLSSTNGSGGVLDIFHERWKFKVALHPKLFAITTQLWEAAYSSTQKHGPTHPYGSFDANRGYMYLDRIGYRLPTALAQELGSSKKRPMQRSLTPHLDCCPETFYDTTKKTKWRPIQCFVSITDALLPNQGGFEAVKGFHREFHAWNRQSTAGTGDPPPCIGEYTHIRPHEDKAIMDRVEHIPVPAGSAVFWDERIPHANAYRHNGMEPRAVVYCSFLPDIPLNRAFVKQQLSDWWSGTHPTDQWIRCASHQVIPSPEDVLSTPLERELAGLYLSDEVD